MIALIVSLQINFKRKGLIFIWKGQEFVLVVDYFSRYCEIGVLRKSTSQEVINHLKAIFARHGIPETVISDNGPQYSSAEFAKFAEDWGFTHITSSPKYPQSNGEAERMVQTTKNLLTKSDDPYEALLAYRATPLENGFSPAELCMGRRLRTTLPTTPSKLTLQWPELPKLHGNEAKIKTEQTKDYDSRHAVKELSHLSHDFCFVFEDPPKCLGFRLRRLFSGTFLSCISDMSAAFELF